VVGTDGAQKDCGESMKGRPRNILDEASLSQSLKRNNYGTEASVRRLYSRKPQNVQKLICSTVCGSQNFDAQSALLTDSKSSGSFATLSTSRKVRIPSDLLSEQGKCPKAMKSEILNKDVTVESNHGELESQTEQTFSLIQRVLEIKPARDVADWVPREIMSHCVANRRTPKPNCKCKFPSVG